ncbi:MAG: glycine cleavage T C-terminal barrel domain-containing protein, partial [Ilumatobacter sp.]
IEFVGKEALRRIRDEGVSRRQVGLVIEMEPLGGPNTTFWPVLADGETVGQVTSAVWSPRLEQNIALAMVAVEHSGTGTSLEVMTDRGAAPASVVDTPFYDPKKSLAAT